MTNLKSQSGRSMVEMLGVLAIIGVLSIGGIAGYTMAMNRYKANEVINAAAMLSIANQSSQSETATTLKGLGLKTDGTTTDTIHGCQLTGTAKKATVTISCGTNTDIATAISNITGGNGIGEDGQWTTTTTTPTE